MTEVASPQGLFGGFEGHRAPTDAEMDEVLRGHGAMISLDTNVLLGLYRYSDERSASLRRGLQSHRDQLFLSHQAQVEFWRNRASVLADRARASQEAQSGLQKAQSTATNAIEAWAKAVSVEIEDLASARAQVERHFASLQRLIEDQHAEDTENYPSPADDALVLELEQLLDGKVGPASAPEEQRDRILEGRRRFDQGEPPGFCEKEADKVDLPEGVSGDYLVWRQTIDEAAKRKVDVVLVTADVKDDWYWRVRGQVIGPRSELSMELLRETGRRLYMLTPLQLEERWRESDGSYDAEAEQTSGEVSIGDGTATETVSTDASGTSSWNEELVHEALRLLREQAPVQARVILAAAEHGGRVDRATVYKLGNYAPERMLRGFTKPVTRIARMLQERGVLAADVPDLLVPRYDRGVQASSFDIPVSVVPWVLSVKNSASIKTSK